MKAHDFGSTLSRMISLGVLEKRQSELSVPREIRRGHVNIVHKVGESEGKIGEACSLPYPRCTRGILKKGGLRARAGCFLVRFC